MKHLKLFEQNWWENAKDHGETVPGLNIDGIVIINNGGTTNYMVDGIKDDVIKNLYKDYNYHSGMSNGWSIIDDPTPNTSIQVYENKNWRTYLFKDLPQNIKDGLVKNLKK